MKKQRFLELDILRGLAVLLMIIFHFTWDLNHFNFIQTNMYQGFWGVLQKYIAGSFLLLVGVSLTLSYHKRKEHFTQHAIKRGSQVFGLGLLITLATFLFMRESFVFFGILHLIGFAIFTSPLFARLKWSNAVIGGLLLWGVVYVKTIIVQTHYLAWLGFMYPGMTTLDFYPVIPWLGMILLGMFIGNTLYKGGKRTFNMSIKENALTNPLLWMGRKALPIYFIHIPVLFGIAYGISLL
jgi:uncharacterized membrane protein